MTVLITLQKSVYFFTNVHVVKFKSKWHFNIQVFQEHHACVGSYGWAHHWPEVSRDFPLSPQSLLHDSRIVQSFLALKWNTLFMFQVACHRGQAVWYFKGQVLNKIALSSTKKQHSLQ